MKKGFFIAVAIAIALDIAFEAWHLNTTLNTRNRLEAVEAHVKAAHHETDKVRVNVDENGIGSWQNASSGTLRQPHIDWNAPDTVPYNFYSADTMTMTTGSGDYKFATQ